MEAYLFIFPPDGDAESHLPKFPHDVEIEPLENFDAMSPPPAWPLHTARAI
jgi:hypothetical protein